MSRPLLAPCLAYCAGVVAMQLWEGDPVLVAWLLIVCVIGWLLFRSHRRAISLLGFLSAGSLVWFFACVPWRADDLRALTDPENELVSVRGRLLETPSLKVVGPPEAPRLRTRVVLRVEGLRRGSEWVQAAGDVLVTVPGALSAGYFRTRLVEVSGVLHPPPVARALGLFDARTFYADQGVWKMLDSERLADWRLVDAGPVSPPWSERFLPWARRQLSMGLPDDESTRLLSAMALGWKTPLTGEVDDAFMQSGTLHVFAISGLHIALVAGLLVGGLSLFRIPRAVAGLLAIPCVWFYIAATGWQASAIRSGIMISVIALGWFLSRPSDLLNSLAAAALAILLFDPGQLFQAGFLLSFVAVAGLGLLVPRIQAWLLERLLPRPDPMLLESLQPRWIQWAQIPVRALCLSLATGLSAGLATLPLVWHFFHLVSPISVLANLVVVPLSSLALAAEFGSLLVGPLIPWLGELFNASAWVWMKLMVGCGRLAAQVPGGHLWVAAPAWYWWVPWYAGGIAAVGGAWASDRWRWILSAGVGVWLASAAVQFGMVRSTARWTLLDPPGALWMDPTWSHPGVLVDSGSAADAAMVVIPFVHARGVGHFPRLLLSRCDHRHAGGVGAVLGEFEPYEVLVSAGWRPSLISERIGASWSARLRVVETGTRLNGIECLHPDFGSFESISSDAAVVLDRKESRFRLVWIGDLGAEGQRRLTARLQPGRGVDVLFAAVPPRGGMLSEALLDRLQPRAVVIASEPPPSPRQVPAETWRRLRSRGIPLLRTDRHGSVRLVVRGDELRLESQRGFIRSLTPATP